jgi:hypothetical protein
MIFNEPIYFCSECKKILTNIKDLYFIRDHTDISFCSEECIEDFYQPLSSYLVKKIKNSLEKNEDEFVQFFLDSDEELENVSMKYDQKIAIKNDLNEEIFICIKFLDRHFIAIISTFFENEVSYIFVVLKSNSKKLLTDLRKNNSIEVNAEIDPEIINEELKIIEMVEAKKSHFLSDLLMIQRPSDIQFEDFFKYDKELNETLYNPDEVYEFKDKEGDLIISYLKSFVVKGNQVIYVVLLAFKQNINGSESKIFPILSFPTNDFTLYSNYKIGKKVTSALN